MTREELDTLRKRVEIATELFNRKDNLESTIAGIRKCYLTVHNADDVRAIGIRVKEQEAIRTIVLEQLNAELALVTTEIATARA
jgi:hypothetical protein